MITIELTDAEAQAIVDHVFGVDYNAEALRTATSKLSRAVDAERV